MNNYYQNLILLFATLAIVLITFSCSSFQQDDFIVSQKIHNNNDQIVYYDVYQTGIDNYRFEFYYVNSDTIKLFNHYLNDAVYTVLDFDCFSNNDTIIIKSNLEIESQTKSVNDGTTVVLY